MSSLYLPIASTVSISYLYLTSNVSRRTLLKHTDTNCKFVVKLLYTSVSICDSIYSS